MASLLLAMLQGCDRYPDGRSMKVGMDEPCVYIWKIRFM